jgi:LPS-assembly protein
VRFLSLVLSCVVCLVAVRTATAQQPDPPPAQSPSGTGSRLLDQINQRSLKSECKGDYCILTGQVELPLGTQTTLFADQIELFRDTNRVIAQGNVVFASPEGRLSAERLEYDVSSGTGTFRDATGLMSMGAQADRRQFGNQDPDVYFYGEVIERLGPKRYRLTRGAFTTCVQPTPRWEVASGSVTLNLNDYATAKGTVLRVKGVPVLYLPMIYYPISEDQRSTGFLLPTYGTSTVRGQAISNAFFWAINRSTDATFFHDWFTKAGQGAGTEYRYVAAEQSMGDVRFYRFSRKNTTYVDDNTNQTQTLEAANSYEVVGNVNHALTRNIRARARLDYFTDLVTQQLYNQNLYAATRNRRLIEAGLTAGFGPVMTSMLYQRSELFTSDRTSQIYGSAPRVSANYAPQRLFNAPIYASANAEYAVLPNRSISDGVVVSDLGYSRLDVAPTVRVPMSRLTFLSVNTSATYRTTYYSKSSLLTGAAVVDDPYVRQYATLRSEIVGPVFNRIWDLEGGFAERVKHVIEPAFTVDFTSNINDYNRTPSIGSDVTDFVVSGSTRYTYGLTNRLFARGRTVDGVRGTTRELLTVGLQQTYYSNPQAGGYDSSYQSTSNRRPTDLSPLTLMTRFAPTALVDTNGRIEYDVARGRGLQVVSIGGTVNGTTVSAGTNFSHNRLDPSNHSTYVQGSTSLRWLDGRATGTYNISWDIGRSYVVSQGAMLSYFAQCCGLTMEFQKFNYASLGNNLAVPSDMRFNFGFTLAGLGTIPTNFFGAFGGGTTR